MRHLLPQALSLALALAACDSGDGSPRPDATVPNDDAGSSPDAGPSVGEGGPGLLDAGPDAGPSTGEGGLTSDASLTPDAAPPPRPTGPPVQTGAPNVPENVPAFPEQTRAPEIKTQTAFEVVEVADGLASPWGLAFLPDGRFLVTEKLSANLFIITPEGAKSAPVTGLPPVAAAGQGGLLDVEVGPDFATSGLIYWTYYEPREGGNGLAVARGKLVEGAQPSVQELAVIFRMVPTLNSSAHAGGRLVFAPDGTLFVTLGERSILAGRVQAQDLNSHFGKIVRIHPDGTVPTDNPFFGMADARPEIWTRGHRNILSAALDRQNRLWIADMGPAGGDELNLIARGKDYGWPTIGYGEEYDGRPIHESTQAAGLEQPQYYWDPVIAPSGMVIYSGTLFPEWKDNIFIGALSGTSLVRLMMEGDLVVGEERLLTERAARIRDVAQGPEGALYLLTDASPNGLLLKVVPKAAP